MTAKFYFKEKANTKIGEMLINDFKSMEVIESTDQTILVSVNEIRLVECELLRFFAQPINVEIIE